MKVHSIIIMGMLLGFDSYTIIMCSYLVQAILQCFYKNMHLPIVLCCDMKIHVRPTKLTIGCEFHKIVSLCQV